MPELGHSSIDDTVQKTNEWLNDIAERIGGDKAEAWHVLRAGLHAIRDRMMAEEAVDFAQQLPTLVRGVWFEGWRPADAPKVDRDASSWLTTLEDRLRQLAADDHPAADPAVAARAIFASLKARIGAGQLKHLETQMPKDVAQLLRDA